MLESRLVPSLPLEIIAIDEVGRSPLCGPVVVGGLRLFIKDLKEFSTLLRSLRSIGIKDSKLLTSDKRKKILQKLNLENLSFRESRNITYKNFELSFLTSEIGPDIIDQRNIFQSVLQGMREVVTGLADGECKRTLILIDGPFFLHFDQSSARWIEVPIVQGDRKSCLIGLASILAKETRDDYMKQIHNIYPDYGLNVNMGYPTKFHREALVTLGPTPFHRKSFGTVKKLQTKKVE